MAAKEQICTNDVIKFEYFFMTFQYPVQINQSINQSIKTDFNSAMRRK